MTLLPYYIVYRVIKINGLQKKSGLKLAHYEKFWSHFKPLN